MGSCCSYCRRVGKGIHMNKKKILLLTAAGVAIAVSFSLIGMSAGISIASSDYAKRPANCTVKDQELANFTRAREIDQNLEAKIDQKARILGEIGSMRAEKKALAFDIEQQEAELLQVSVDLERQRRALRALKAE